MITGFQAQNHPQQTAKRGALDHVDDRGTDPTFIANIAAELGGPFTLDVAASERNHKAAAYFTRADDGLAQTWNGRVWCNPPYSNIIAWTGKAWSEWDAGHASLIAMLLPANRCEQRWWQEHVEPRRDRADSPLTTRFLPGRMRFDRPDAIPDPRGDRPPFGCVLLIWR